MAKRAPEKSGKDCRWCSTALEPGARYCHACGRKQDGAGLTTGRIAVFGAIVLVLAGVAAVMMPMSFDAPQTREAARPVPLPGAVATPIPAPAPVQGDPGAVNLAAMTPREAADRLFNRVMQASETGNTAEALQFAPMALEAYRLVPVLDADAHFHVGLISSVSGDAAGVRDAVARLREYASDHLLAYDLEYRLAPAGSPEALAILGAFLEAYDAEIATNREEYLAHRNGIEKLRSTAMMSAAALPPAPEVQASASPGQALFSANCARCHGAGAVGTASGPPLVHKIYEPSHHGDDAFVRAVTRGARSHHWKFGDMPAIPGVTPDEVEQITAYVRELQRAAGIF